MVGSKRVPGSPGLVGIAPGVAIEGVALNTPGAGISVDAPTRHGVDTGPLERVLGRPVGDRPEETGVEPVGCIVHVRNNWEQESTKQGQLQIKVKMAVDAPAIQPYTTSVVSVSR